MNTVKMMTSEQKTTKKEQASGGTHQTCHKVRERMGLPLPAELYLFQQGF